MMSVTTAAKIGVGMGMTVATVRTFRVSNPISILGLAVTGQAIAWMPGFAALCLRSLKRKNSLPLSAAPLTPLPREVLTHIQGPLDTEKIEAGELGEATDPMGEAIDQFDDAETVTLEELREIRAFYPNFSRPQKKFSLDMSQTDITDEELGSIIAHFPNITEITAQDCQSLTDLGLEHLTGLANLTTLDLGKTLWITDDSLLLLASLENLTT